MENRMKLKLLLFLVVAFGTPVLAQTNNVGIGTTTPDNSAILHLDANNKGLLVPRFALNNVNSATPVSSPAEGLLIYNDGGTAPEGFYYWNGTKWIQVMAGAGTVANSTLRWNSVTNTWQENPYILSDPAGSLILSNNSAASQMRLAEDIANGTNYTGFSAPSALSADIIYRMPTASGATSDVLTLLNPTTGQLGWVAVAGGGGGGSTLDQAYDLGGPGNGRTINVDAGSVFLNASDSTDYAERITKNVNGGLLWLDNGGKGLGLRIDSQVKDSAFVVNSDGLVGVGTNPTRTLDVNGTVRLGASGNTITHMIRTNVAAAAFNVNAGQTVALNLSVANAETGSSVMVSPELDLNADIVLSHARVSAAGNVEVKFRNVNLLTNRSVGAMNWYVTVIK